MVGKPTRVLQNKPINQSSEPILPYPETQVVPFDFEMPALALPLDTAVPLLLGQAWRFLAGSAATITEILFSYRTNSVGILAHCPVSTMAPPSLGDIAPNRCAPSFATRRGLKCTTALRQPTTASQSASILMPVRLFFLWSPPMNI